MLHLLISFVNCGIWLQISSFGLISYLKWTLTSTLASLPSSFYNFRITSQTSFAWSGFIFSTWWEMLLFSYHLCCFYLSIPSQQIFSTHFASCFFFLNNFTTMWWSFIINTNLCQATVNVKFFVGCLSWSQRTDEGRNDLIKRIGFSSNIFFHHFRVTQKIPLKNLTRKISSWVLINSFCEWIMRNEYFKNNNNKRCAQVVHRCACAHDWDHFLSHIVYSWVKFSFLKDYERTHRLETTNTRWLTRLSLKAQT